MAADQKLTQALTELSKVKPKDKPSNTALAQAKSLIREAKAELPTPPVEPPAPPVSSLIVGLDSGAWGQTGADDAKGCVKWVRYEIERGPSQIATFRKAGLKVIMNFAGPNGAGPEDRGVKGLSADKWAANTLAFYKANTTPTDSPLLEVLNEPGGDWFWGDNANSQENADAYRVLIKKTYDLFHAEYGNAAPKILATLDGNEGLKFGERLKPKGLPYLDGVIVHPYGGTGSRTESAKGNRDKIEDAYALAEKPVYCTEIGWPTAVGKSPTGDSLQWSESEQAQNIINFGAWCRTKPYVAAFIYFQYRDFSDNSWYGVCTASGSKKPSYAALKSVAT